MNCRLRLHSYIAAVMLAAVLTVMPSGAFAERRPMHLASSANINLRSEQRQKLQRHIQASRKKESAVKDELTRQRRALFEQLRKYDVNERRIQESVQKINRLQIRLHKVRLENQLGLRKILTKEQFAHLGNAVLEKGAARKNGARRSSGSRIESNVEQLNLTSDQQKRIKKLFEKSRATMQPIRQGIRSENEALNKLYLKYDLDSRQANTRINKLGAKQLSSLRAIVSRQIALRSILTKEQFKTLAQTMRSPGSSGN